MISTLIYIFSTFNRFNLYISNISFITACKYPDQVTKIAACTTDPKNCDKLVQQAIFENFFALGVAYLLGSTSIIPFLALDINSEANNLGYATGEDGTIGNIILVNSLGIWIDKLKLFRPI